MFHDLRIISCLLLSFLAVPEEGTYTIEIPRSIDLSQEDSFEIRIKENGLSDNEVLHITMPDSFELNDVESHDTICGQIENNSFDVCKDDYSSRTVNCLIDEIPIGDWHGRIDIRMDLEKTIATNLLICGPQLNNILRQIEPLSIEFNGDPFPEAEEYFDVSAAQDDSIFVYECSGYGALVKFSDITGKGRYVVSWKGGRHEGEC